MTKPETDNIISRDELAARMRVTSRQFRNIEKRIGLTQCRIQINVRPCLYRLPDALRILRKLGYPV